MCAKGAEGPIHEVDAQHVIRYSSPLNLINLEFGLSNHPDKLFVEKILEYTKNGVPVGYSGPRKLRIHQNWPSANRFASAVKQSIQKELSKGRKAGPFDLPPFDTFVGSPMDAFPK